MLGKELNTLGRSIHSKSSIMPEEMDEKKLIGLIEDKDRTIRKLTKKIQKLEQTLKRTISDRNLPINNTEQDSSDNFQLQLLKAEIDKTKRLEDIIEDITDRINAILEDISHDNTFTDNSQEIREMLNMIEQSHQESISENFLENELQKSINISSEWTKKIDLLQGAFKSFKAKFHGSTQSNKSLGQLNEELKKKINYLELKLQDRDDIKGVVAQLKEEKKQREKLKKLLQKSEYEKNQLINKISQSGMKEADIRAKTKEELLQYSKELHYRVRDLEKEKDSLLKESTKDKQEDLKKYQQFLKKLKIIKEKSIMGKSCA